MPDDTDPEFQRIHKAVQEGVVEISRQSPQLTINQLRGSLQGRKELGINADNNFTWLRLDVLQVVKNLIAEGRVVGRVESGSIVRSAKIFFDVEANNRLFGEIQSTNTQNIKRTVLDLGTKFTRLQVAEIAESCQVTDEALIIATVEDMIAKHQIDAKYFTSTRSVAFNQLANLQSRDAFIAGLEAEFASWGKKEGKI